MNDDRDQVLGALAAVVRDQLIEGRRVVLPLLGTLSVRHVASKVVANEDGEDMMLPPRDVVHFEPWSGEAK